MLRFIRNIGLLDVANNSSEPLIFNKDNVLGVVDMKSIGYYKLKQSIIQHHLETCCHFKALQVLYKEFNKLTST